MNDDEKTDSEVIKILTDDILGDLKNPEVAKKVDDELLKKFDSFSQTITGFMEGIGGSVGELIHVVEGLGRWAENMEQVVHNHNVRLNTIETIFTHEDFKKDREDFINNKLKIERFKEIIETFVLPTIKKQHEEIKKQQQEALAKLESESQVINVTDATVQKENNIVRFPDKSQTIIKSEED